MSRDSLTGMIYMESFKKTISEKDGVFGVYYEHKSGSQIGYKTFYRGVYSKCIRCGKDFFSLLSQQKRLGKGKYCSKSCSKIGKMLSAKHVENISISKLGEKNPRWSGGKTTLQGYFLLKRPNHPNSNSDGYILEHRLVMSNHIGRPLNKTEVVHHKNSDRKDNRIENLELLTRSSHA